MTWQLADIRKKARQITGRFSSTQLTNQRLDEYINNYYVFSLPNELKLEREHTFYEFNTTPLTRDYTFPSGYVNFEPPVWLDGYDLLFYQDPTVWYQENPLQIARYSVGTGDGATFNYIFSVNPSIVPGSAIITDNNETGVDDSSGAFTGDVTGTIDYTTGDVDVTFTTQPASGEAIVFSWEPYTASRPTSVMLYNNVFRFSPTPDTVYRTRVKAYRLESELTSATETPRLEEWGPAIAYGAARQIVSDFGEQDKYAEITALYNEQLAYIMRRTHQNLLNDRARPMF